MYATIEPRLIALLNDSQPENMTQYSRLDLPPLNRSSILKPPERQPPFEHETPTPKRHATTNRALGSSSPQSLRKILDDDPARAGDSANEERPAKGVNKDDFVQLPRPPKKHIKAAKQVVPPIIIGLIDPPPPPSAALFPPIASSSFHDSRGRNSLNIAVPNQQGDSQDEFSFKPNLNLPNDSSLERSATSPEIRPSVRPRRKWTEEETRHMLLGVARHGVGNWTKILNDPEFNFNGRKAVDIKDRFRTCCPEEFRSNGTSVVSLNARLTDAASDGSSSEEIGRKHVRRTSKSRAHRKNVGDLAKLGIKEPFKKSERRQRRPFTEQDDQNLLEGLELYGPSWSLIAKDPKLCLGSRRPTDLRDRLRNKYPEKYNKDEEVRGSLKESSLTGLEPSIQDRDRGQQSLNLCNVDSRFGSKLPFQSFLNIGESYTDLLSQSLNEWPDSMHFSASGVGDMDLSRILMDDTWNSVSGMESKQKQAFSDINENSPTNAPHIAQYDPIYDTSVWDSHTVNLPLPK